MSKLYKIVFFIVLTTLLQIGLFFVFKRITVHKSELLKEEELIKNLETIDLLIVGDSHAKRCVDASKFENAFNSAYYGENPALTYYHLNHLISDLGITPKTILIQIDLTRFAKNFLSHYKNKFFYLDFVDNNELLDLGIITKEEWLENQLFKVFPQLELTSVLKRTNNKESKVQKTFATYSSSQRSKMAHNFIFNQLIPGGYVDLYDKTSLIFLNKTIQLCQENDIKLIAIKYPVTDYYINTVIEICNRDLNISSPQEKIIRENNIPIIDLEKAFADQYELFSDSHHMNLAGKEKCTELIKLNLESLQFINNP